MKLKENENEQPFDIEGIQYKPMTKFLTTYDREGEIFRVFAIIIPDDVSITTINSAITFIFECLPKITHAEMV